MKRLLVYVFSMFALFLLQTTVFHVFLPLTAITPNFLMVFAASFALMRGDRTGLVLGFFSGLLSDIVFGEHLGFYAFILMFACFLAGQFYQSFSADRFFSAFLLIGGCDLFYSLACYVLLFLLRSRFHFRFYFAHVILPETVATITAAVVLYPLFFLVNEALEADELRRAKKFV